jgi:hypothetical protein
MKENIGLRARRRHAASCKSCRSVKNAKAAYRIMIWKDEHMIDTLTIAHAETGDFNSAVQYAAQALTVKGISADSTKVFQQHLAFFQQHKPIVL